MTPYESLIATLIKAIDLHSDGSWSWYSHRMGQLPARSRRSLDAEAKRKRLRYEITGLLYQSFYVSGGAVRWRPMAWRSPGGDSAFLARLSAANQAVGPWQAGWTLIAEDPDLVVERDGLQLRAAHHQVRATRTLEVGEPVEVQLPSEHRNISPGYYMALGDRDDTQSSDGYVRYYWHLTPGAAETFVAEATRRLNDTGLAFRLKVLNDPRAFQRCDAGVVYVVRAEHESAMAVLLDIHDVLGDGLRDAVPALTLAVRPGLAIAEDPADGNSFGISRCELIADGLIAAKEARIRTNEGRLEAVRQAFSDAGYDLARPYAAVGRRLQP